MDLRKSVAMAIADAMRENQNSASAYLVTADAAIKAVLDALKEPSDSMVQAANAVEVKGADLHDFAAHDCAEPIWKAMLTAFTRDHYLSALAEENGKEL